jgi:hypothetical protein
MTLQDLASISQIAQAVLVVVSLGFIWYQLQEGVRLAKSENARSLAEQAGGFNSLLIQNADLAELWYSYGRKLEQDGEIARPRYREMLVQWLIFHGYIYYQWKQKLLDDEIYRSWLADLELEDVVQKHNLEVFSSGIQNVFCGDFGRYLSQLRAKVRRNAA